jgi:hypothetical protein
MEVYFHFVAYTDESTVRTLTALSSRYCQRYHVGLGWPSSSLGVRTEPPIFVEFIGPIVIPGYGSAWHPSVILTSRSIDRLDSRVDTLFSLGLDFDIIVCMCIWEKSIVRNTVRMSTCLRPAEKDHHLIGLLRYDPRHCHHIHRPNCDVGLNFCNQVASVCARHQFDHEPEGRKVQRFMPWNLSC